MRYSAARLTGLAYERLRQLAAPEGGQDSPVPDAGLSRDAWRDLCGIHGPMVDEQIAHEVILLKWPEGLNTTPQHPNVIVESALRRLVAEQRVERRGQLWRPVRGDGAPQPSRRKRRR